MRIIKKSLKEEDIRFLTNYSQMHPINSSQTSTSRDYDKYKNIRTELLGKAYKMIRELSGYSKYESIFCAELGIPNDISNEVLSFIRNELIEKDLIKKDAHKKDYIISNNKLISCTNCWEITHIRQKKDTCKINETIIPIECEHCKSSFVAV
jgi:hypothetical protein